MLLHYRTYARAATASPSLFTDDTGFSKTDKGSGTGKRVLKTDTTRTVSFVRAESRLLDDPRARRENARSEQNVFDETKEIQCGRPRRSVALGGDGGAHRQRSLRAAVSRRDPIRPSVVQFTTRDAPCITRITLSAPFAVRPIAIRFFVNRT